MKHFISIVLLTSSFASMLTDPITMKIRKISGKELLIKSGRYDSYLERKMLSKAVLSSTNQSVYEHYDNYYVGDLYIGTPEQYFSVLIDTTSSLSWVGGISCKSVGCIQKEDGIPAKNLFDPSKSSTYIAQKATFNDDGNVKGNLALDTLNFGGLGVSNETIGIASYLPDILMYYALDGTLGLGWNEVSKTVSTLDNYLNQLPMKIFTIFYNLQPQTRTDPPLLAGQITYGGLDRVHCSTNIQYVPLYQAGFPYWQFIMSGYQFGTYFDNSNHMAVIDTRTGGIIMPQIAYDVFQRQSGAFILDGDLTIHCDKIGTLPDIIFTINKVQYRISSKNYVPNFPGHTFCGVQVFPGLYNDNNFYFGDAWLRTVCNVFDVGNKQIGFAQINKF